MYEGIIGTVGVGGVVVELWNGAKSTGRDANPPSYIPAFVVVIVKVFLETYCKIYEEGSKDSGPSDSELVEKRQAYAYGEQLPEVIAVWWVSFLLYVIPFVIAAARTRFEPFLGSIIISIGGYGAMIAAIFRYRSLKKFIRNLTPPEEELMLLGPNQGYEEIAGIE